MTQAWADSSLSDDPRVPGQCVEYRAPVRQEGGGGGKLRHSAVSHHQHPVTVQHCNRYISGSDCWRVTNTEEKYRIRETLNLSTPGPTPISTKSG